MGSKHMHAAATRDQGPCGPDIHGLCPQSVEWVAVASECLPSPPVSQTRKKSSKSRNDQFFWSAWVLLHCGWWLYRLARDE